MLPSCSPNYPRASRIGWTHARHCPFLKMNNDRAHGNGESLAWLMISDIRWGRSCKGQEQKLKHLNLGMDVGRRNVIVYSSFPEVSQSFSLLRQSGNRTVLRRKRSPDWKWSPMWTANNTAGMAWSLVSRMFSIFVFIYLFSLTNWWIRWT